LRDDLAVQLVRHAALDQHGDGLGALVADHLANEVRVFLVLAH
jgi:hypothetical protein